MQELPVQERDELLDIERQSGTFSLGRKEGRQEGRQEGHQEGRREGQREALIELIFALLADRGIAVDAASETRVRGETLPVLKQWARRAARVGSIAELIEAG